MPLAGMEFIPSMGGFMTGAGALAQMLLVFGIVAAIAYAVMYLGSFNIPVLCVIKIGNGYKISNDKGRLIKKNDDKEFEVLKYRKVIWPYPESKHFYQVGKGVGVIAVIENQSCSFATIDKNDNFKPADINMLNYAVSRFRRNEEATRGKQSFWQQYGQSILWGGTLVICFVIIILILKRVDKALEMGTQVINSCRVTV